MDSHSFRASRCYVGQVERDRDGVLWASLYAAPTERREFLLTREVVRSVRHGRRRVCDLVLAEADADRVQDSAGRRH